MIKRSKHSYWKWKKKWGAQGENMADEIIDWIIEGIEERG
jgi:hypothetical protein